MQHPPSLRSRFALVIALLIICLSWLFGSLIGHDASQRIHAAVGRDLAETGHNLSDRLDRGLQNRIAMLEIIASLEVLHQPGQTQQVRQILEEINQEFSSVAWVGLTDAQGQVLASSNGLFEGRSIAAREVFQQALRQQVIGDVYCDPELAKALTAAGSPADQFIDISLPINNAHGQLLGVLAAHISWSWADEIRRSILRPLDPQRKLEFFILSHDHRVLMGPADSLGKPLELPILSLPKERQETWMVQTWPDQQDYLTGLAFSEGYKDYPGLGWHILARQPVHEAYAPARVMSRNILLLGSLLALLFAFLGWLLAGYYTRPLRQIVRAANRLSAGKVSVIPEFKGTREIQSLSQSIRRLVESLRNQKTALGAMQDLAHHDALTGLPNRIALDNYLIHARQNSRNKNDCLALLYMDLDGFKPINDQHGHAAGDKLLQELALRLRASTRDGDLVARLGGDEFLMVLQVPANTAQEQALQVAKRVLAALRQPVQLEQDVQVGCSIGGAIWPQDSAQLDVALELADRALYQAKAAGRNSIKFHGQSQHSGT
ncbi:GGDEF domain-containing protein [Pseudomonas sp. 5P_3.1_Bac2]|uniref:GGDEF domain-containing protein n=1 Tax=Pseudomonas sp. 5P_3.1_Bac2 TaxID=2971617 RepID=UPI0021C58124|nr:GGDEF domain-containing protein [Pseudomonas sp. 5P_3.1_Bac2]MCU1719628.1 GGDEF domain-containing protein [Pseudomonas sp. 5P_3.1_Bac2]